MPRSPSSLLTVIPPIAEKALDCANCSCNARCNEAAPKHVKINYLVCQLVHHESEPASVVNAAAKELLTTLQPMLKKLTKWACRHRSVDFETALADMRSELIYCVMHKYRFESGCYPLQFLFGLRGYLKFYSNGYARAETVYKEHVFLRRNFHVADALYDHYEFGASQKTEIGEIYTDPEPEIDETEPTVMTDRARWYVQHGEGFTDFELQVLKAYLTGMRQTAMSKTWGIPMPKISYALKQARQKLKDMCKIAPHYLGGTED